MKLLPISLFAIFPLILTACSQQVWDDMGDITHVFDKQERKGVAVTQGYPEPKANYGTNSTKTVKTTRTVTKNGRIDTTQCTDADDWYLDGYRVGKSFTAQKAAMYQQRLNSCQGKLAQPHQFQQNWEKGFNIGAKKA